MYPSAYGLPKFVVAHEALPLGRVDVVVLLLTEVVVLVDDEVGFVWVHDDVEEEVIIELVDPPLQEGW